MKTSELDLRQHRGQAIDSLALCRLMGILDQAPMVDYDTVSEPWSWRKERYTPRQFGELWRRQLEHPDVSPDYPVGLYVHVPFCTHSCSYCRCFRLEVDGGRDLLERYVDFLCAQADFFAPFFEGRPIRYFSVGGGTPSILSGGQIARVLSRLRQRFTWAVDNPMSTFEMTVPTMHDATLRALAAEGVPRVSVGVQTLRPEIRTANRMFPITEKRLADRIARAHESGLLVNVDLILGFPDESAEQFLEGFRYVLAQRPASIILNVLNATYFERVAGTGPSRREGDADFLARVAAGLAEQSAEAGYVAHPHSNSLESIGFFSREFEGLFERHGEVFKRLASGVLSVRGGTSVFALGSVCNSGLLPDYLVAATDQSYEFDPDREMYQCSRKEVYGLLYPVDEDRGVAFDARQNALLDRVLQALAKVAPDVQILRSPDDVTLQFVDPDQAEGVSRAFVRPGDDPRVHFRRIGAFALAYNDELTGRMRAVLTVFARLVLRVDPQAEPVAAPPRDAG
jgi:MoaA/NifB/PqqE/SkfB family radical SAM enzyme